MVDDANGDPEAMKMAVRTPKSSDHTLRLEVDDYKATAAPSASRLTVAKM